MKSFKSAHILLILLLLEFSLLSSAKETTSTSTFACPSSSDDKQSIAPCDCDESRYSGVVSCTGSMVTQSSIDKVIKVLREINGNLKSDDWLTMPSLAIRDTNIQRLDLSSLFRLRFTDKLYIEYNPFLSTIVASNSSGVIDASDLRMRGNYALQDDGFGDTLKYFSARMAELRLYGNFLSGSVFGPEFLPGLSNLTELGKINAQDNQIRSLGIGGFRFNSMLWDLDISANKLESIDKGTFFIHVASQILNEPLRIDLSENRALSEKNFHPNSGLADIPREINLDLSWTNFSTLTAKIFQPFLEAHHGNSLELSNVPLVCDPQLKWLKNRREEFEMYVHNTKCENDPGATVFTSTLIDAWPIKP